MIELFNQGEGKGFLCVIQTGIIIIFCWSCSSKKDLLPSGKNVQDTVVFIFENVNALSREKRYQDGTSFIVDNPSFVFKDEINTYNVEPKKNDTIVVATQSDYIVAFHRTNLIESLEYLFRKGDTVLFTSSNGDSKARVINRESIVNDFDWEDVFRQKEFGKDSFSAMVRYLVPELTSKSTNGINYSEVKDHFYASCMESLNNEDRFLDSLSSNRLISDDVYNHFKDRVKYRTYAMRADNYRLDSVQIADVVKEYSDHPAGSYSNFDYFLNVVVNKLFIDKAKLINTGTGFTKDYRSVFESVQRSTIFTKEVKDRILYQQIIQIANHFSQKDFKFYYEKFREVIPDDSLTRKIESTYLLDYADLRELSKDLHIISASKKKNTLDSLKSIYKGKLIYVDFWASWCGPCRQAMPASRKLMKKYAGKVEFIYLSSDRDYDKWRNALKEEGLEFYKDSYLMINPQFSSFLKKINFGEIPRYILFDEKGNLIHNKAPGPNTIEIEKLFDQNLVN